MIFRTPHPPSRVYIVPHGKFQTNIFASGIAERHPEHGWSDPIFTPDTRSLLSSNPRSRPESSPPGGRVKGEGKEDRK